MHVGGYGLAFFNQQGGEDILCGTALMGGDEEFEAKNAFYGFFKAEVGARPGVGLIALHHGSPLVLAHSTGARICEQIDEDILGTQTEGVKASYKESFFSFITGDQADRFDHLDAEGFGGIGRHEISWGIYKLSLIQVIDSIPVLQPDAMVFLGFSG
jgi:hypothetical protein